LTRSTLIAVLALAAFALAAAGCGGSDSTLSRAEFLKQVDVICLKTSEKNFNGFLKYRRKHPQDFANSASSTAIGKVITAVTVPVVQQTTNELGALAGPAEEEKKVDAFNAEVEQVLAKLKANPASKEATSGAAFRPVAQLGRQYDFRRCANLP
jgi:hypothetical protein